MNPVNRTRLVRRVGNKKVTIFKCRKGTHSLVIVGERTNEEGEKTVLRWCTTCGCLEEASSTTIVRVPDIGI